MHENILCSYVYNLFQLRFETISYLILTALKQEEKYISILKNFFWLCSFWLREMYWGCYNFFRKLCPSKRLVSPLKWKKWGFCCFNKRLLIFIFSSLSAVEILKKCVSRLWLDCLGSNELFSQNGPCYCGCYFFSLLLYTEKHNNSEKGAF